jgi:hypothetical protein
MATLKSIQKKLEHYPFLSVSNRRGVTSIYLGAQGNLSMAGKSKVLPKLADITAGDLDASIVELLPTIAEAKARKSELMRFYNEDKAKLHAELKKENWREVNELSRSLESIQTVLTPIELVYQYLSNDDVTVHCTDCNSDDFYTNFNFGPIVRCNNCSTDRQVSGLYIQHGEVKLPLFSVTWELGEAGYEVKQSTQARSVEPEPYLPWITEFKGNVFGEECTSCLTALTTCYKRALSENHDFSRCEAKMKKYHDHKEKNDE